MGPGGSSVTICRHYLPIVLQIAPIAYGNYATTCPYNYYMYICMYLNTVYQPSVIVMPTSLLYPYMDQIDNVNDLVI